MRSSWLKVPVELAQFALKKRCVSQVKVYLSGLFLWPGKVRYENNMANQIATLCQQSESTVNRSIRWLYSRNWIGKDLENGWYFFRGMNRIHEIEEWQFSRAAIMQTREIKNFKEFLISVVVGSAIKTGRKQEGRTEQPRSRSMPAYFPVPVSFIEKTLDVSRRTAITYMNIAKKADYIEVFPNLEPVLNLTPVDVQRLKLNDIDSVTVQLIGHERFRNRPVNHLRIDNGKVFLQGVNMIRSNVLMGKRRLKHLHYHSSAIKGEKNDNGYE